MKRFIWCTVLATAAIGICWQATVRPGEKKEPATDLEKLAAEVRILRDQLKGPHIVAAGTTTWKLGRVQNNATSVRVLLKSEIAAKLGDETIVILTPRFTGFPYYSAYWKKAKDGFDITLVDPALGPTGTGSFIFEVNRDFPIDWIVVKK